MIERLPTPVPIRRRAGAVERTLAALSHAMDQALFAEELACRAGLLQTLDPRVKVVSLIALLLAAGLSRNLPVIAAIYLLVLILAWRSALPLGSFIARVWLLLPFFTGVIALPALFITPGPALLQLPLGIVITRTGAQTAAFLLMRVSTSVSLATLLVLTTRWNDVLKSLSVLRVPDAIILILGMTYRYIHLLLSITDDMFLSRKSRVVGHQSGAAERRMLGASAGVLLEKSLQLSSEVYLAMQSRGFRGHSHSLKTFRMQTRDWVSLLAALGFAALAIWLGR
ncbi:MAG TPA: cobalt ECF transporter T component CbiQ [Anaerolineae bacterium]